MTSLNRVYLAGNLTRDPELRRTPSGNAVTNMRLAVTEVYTDKSGVKKETTCFVDIETWGRQAETCEQYLSKGSPVLIEGRLKLDEWENEKGEKRSRLHVRADRVQFLGAPRRGEGSDAPRGKSRAAQPPDDEAPPEPPADEPPANAARDDDDLPF
ncbi:MAG: single-stranded DNA-binding protein [Kiritimatiellae bacterium]|nr:single-stranded DNA-binding protein [Kiritimatiellia bacterium]